MKRTGLIRDLDALIVGTTLNRLESAWRRRPLVLLLSPNGVVRSILTQQSRESTLRDSA
jgi:hypothetical protein